MKKNKNLQKHGLWKLTLIRQLSLVLMLSGTMCMQASGTRPDAIKKTFTNKHASEAVPEKVNAFSYQQHVVTGKVINTQGETLPGVNVIEKENATNGVITGIDGSYSITVRSSDAVLVFSFIGFDRQEIVLDGRTTIDITLQEEFADLDEVVVVGYGTQKKVNLTGSISTLKLEDAQNRPITNATQALSGMAAGVSVLQGSGQPGEDAATIRIRGVGTLGNSNPLVLVDGVRASLSSVNAADIDKITVLKDAASSAIYGSRAANGVILITTKSAKRESDFKVSYNGYTGFQKPTKLTDYVTNSAEYMEALNTAIFNEDPTATPAFSGEQINDFRTGNDPYLTPNTDWQDLMYRDAKISSHNVHVSGGGKKTSYALSFGYIDQDGVVLGTNSKQYTGRLNLDTKVSDKFSYSLKLSIRHDDNNEPVVGANTVIGWIERGQPMQAPYTKEGKYTYTPILFANNTHPLAGAQEGKNNVSWDEAVANISGEYNVVKGLKIKGSAAIRTYHYLQKVFRPEIMLHDQADESSTLGQNVGGKALSAYNKYDTNREITLLSQIDYSKTIAEKHHIAALAGFTQETSKFNRLTASKDGIPSNELQEISAGSVDPTAEGYVVDFGLQSFFGRFTYNYMSKYLLEANVRYDGSSNFAEGNKWGLFPSFSAAWNISEEGFLQSLEMIDHLKIRASWGQLGNQQIDPNQYTSFYELGESYSYGGNLVGGAAQTKLSNPDVTWETSTQTDVGIDLTMWKGKLGMVLDYYQKETSDILREVNISSTIGALKPPTVNLASVENRGWELMLTHRNKIGDVSYDASLNLTTIENKVVKLPTPVIDTWSRLEQGRPIDEFYAIKMLGIFQNEAEVTAHGAQPNAKPGDVKFEDFNNDGKIDGEDRQAAGNSIPDFIYGFNASVEYKGFNLSMIWQGVEGVKARTEEEQKPFFNYAGLPRFWLDNAWTKENPNNNYPRLVRGSNYVNDVWRNGSTFLIEDASFLRLKNIQLGYTFPMRLVEKIKLEKLHVYVNATNPLTITDYRGLDPEKNPFGGRGSYTNVQTYTLGMNITF